MKLAKPLRIAVPSIAVPSIAIALAVAAPGAGASTGTIAGKLGALPKSADFGAVEAVDSRGRIDDVALSSDSGAYSLKVAPGSYVLVSSGSSESSSFSSFSPPKAVRKGTKVKLSPKLKSTPLARAASAGKGLIPKGSVLSIEGIHWHVEEGPEQNISSLALNDLYRTCSSKGMVFVDTSPEFVKFASQERALSLAGKLSTPFEYRPLAPQYFVLGIGAVEKPSAAGEALKYDLELNLATSSHQGVNAAQVEVQRTAPSYDFEIFREMLAEASAQFAAKVCG
jgi:hypothetical protein